MVKTQEPLLPELKDRLGSAIISVFEKSPRRLYIDVEASHIEEISRVIFREMGARLQTATAVHLPDGFEVLYHWAFDQRCCTVTLRTRLDKDNPSIASIAPLCKGAEWIEREMWELVGITFKGHPDMRHLLLMDDWPAGKYPLRRDFRGLDR